MADQQYPPPYNKQADPSQPVPAHVYVDNPPSDVYPVEQLLTALCEFTDLASQVSPSPCSPSAPVPWTPAARPRLSRP